MIWTEYNDKHDVESITDRLNKTTSFTYNSYGQLETQTDPLTILTQYIYDANYQLSQVKRDGNGAWIFGYDNNSRLTSVDGPWQDDTLTYGYDDLGRRTSLTPQGSTALSYVYDTLNRLTTIQAGTGNYVYAYTAVNPLVQSLM